MFYEIFKIYLTTTNLGHHGHMTWYILNILDNIPSQDVLVTSVWYILNVLNICWFGMLLVLRPRPYIVLAMYQVGTSPLAPSVFDSARAVSKSATFSSFSIAYPLKLPSTRSPCYASTMSSNKKDNIQTH